MSLGKVVVGGGTGLIGTNLIKALTNEGFAPICVSRCPPRNVNAITWKDIESNGLPEDTLAAINLAGINVLSNPRWTERFKQEVWDSRVETTKTMAKAVANSNAKVFGTICGVGYYPAHPTAEYTEESICEPTDFFSKLCIAWEAAGQLPENCKARRFVIRSGAVLLPKGMLVRSIYLFSKYGICFATGSGKQWMPWIHITDLCNMFIFAIKNEHVSGILNGVSPHTVTNYDYTKALGTAAGARIVVPFTPSSMLKFLLHPERAAIALTGAKVLPERTQKLGFKYQYANINDACANIVSEVKKLT